MTDLTSYLLKFAPISLKEMDRVKLLDRVDTKYVIHLELLEEHLITLQDQYKVLAIEGILVHPYETLYYDTPEYHLYRMHHSGRQNRFKIRFRKYVNSDLAFFEIKTKTNTHRTVKKRIAVDRIMETLNDPLNNFITNNTIGTSREYVPVLRVFFNRVTLVNNLANERLTIDTDIRYKSNGEEKIIEDMVVVEVKQKNNCTSPFQQLMQGTRQRSNYISKYCLGVVCMNSDIKHNRFKARLNSLNKLGYDFH